MKLVIQNEQEDLPLQESSLEAIVQNVLKLESVETDEVIINFVDTPTICELHDEHFDDPSTTDCMSFPIDPEGLSPYRVLGEIFVCPETAIAYTKSQGQDDVYKELMLYVVHGLLHLVGYDDIEERDRKLMRAAEKKHMDHLCQLGLSLAPLNN